MKQVVLSMLVDNTPGVLSRVAGLFSRRGYNITSLSSGETQDPKITRMTVVVKGDYHIIEQIKNQLSKLEDIREIIELQADDSVTRELILVKVEADKSNRENIMTLADIFRAKIVDVSSDSMIVELTGSEIKLNAFIKLLDDYSVKEFVRTGLTGLPRGSGDVIDTFE